MKESMTQPVIMVNKIKRISLMFLEDVVITILDFLTLWCVCVRVRERENESAQGLSKSAVHATLTAWVRARGNDTHDERVRNSKGGQVCGCVHTGRSYV